MRLPARVEGEGAPMHWQPAAAETFTVEMGTFLVSEAAIGQAGNLDGRSPASLLRVAVGLDDHRG